MLESENVLAKVRKLMRLANDAGATEGERENALRMAHAFLAKYNLDMAAVAASDPAQNEKREDSSHVMGAMPPWARQIAFGCARLYFCQYYFSGRAKEHHFIGRHSNVVTASEMAQWLIEAVRKEASAYVRANGGGRSASTSFATGAAMKLFRRCEELRKASITPVAAAAPGTALVLADFYKTEETANREFLRSAGIHLRSRSVGATARDSGAYVSGAAFGGSLNLNRQVTSGGRRLLA